MPTITAGMIDTVAPGNLFSELVSNDRYNIRWLVGTEPVVFEVFNRPLADVVVRQLILAKAVDTLQLSLSHQALFPFIVQAQVADGSSVVDLPPNWIFDLHVSLPKKWEQLRLAKIKRISGANDSTDGYSGTLRLIFTGVQEDSATEVALFYADYVIDSDLAYQQSRVGVVRTPEESTVVAAGEVETISGFITLHTLDNTDLTVIDFLDLVVPPSDTADADSNGLFDDPAVYEIVDTVAGGAAVTGDFSESAVSHGTGRLTDSAWNAIPSLDSDMLSWIDSFNYPFDADANLTSEDAIAIPAGLFREFNLTAPAGDEPTGDVSGTYFPVWISRIERLDTGDQLRFYFATYNVTDTDASTEAQEFASLDLARSLDGGEKVSILPIDDLLLVESDDALFHQHFGRGHVVLSSIWDDTSDTIGNFFDAFDAIATDPPDTTFPKASTLLSAFGISRVPKYVPTIGQSQALRGTSARLETPLYPSDSNRYVTELDQGLGDQVDLESESGITPHTAINRYGYSGSLAHRIIRMDVNAKELGSDPDFYDDELLPRLTILLGRAPVFGDVWYDGVRFKQFNGDTWIG